MNDDDRASRPDDENPEWTVDDVRTARPALDVFGEVFGPEVAATLPRGRGRPLQAVRKVNQTLRLDADVLEAYRSQGPGWHAQMNRVLREHMPAAQGMPKPR